MDEEQQEYLYQYEPQRGLRRSVITTIIAFVVVVVLAFVSATLVKRYYTATYWVEGDSMQPTLDGGRAAFGKEDEEGLYDGDKVIVWTRGEPSRGDIVVSRVDENFYFGEPKVLIKRVIAIGGDTVRLSAGKTFVNGEEIQEDYVNGTPYAIDAKNNIEITVPAGSIFCMGDNRNNSTDCRDSCLAYGADGCIQLDTEYVGKVILIAEAGSNNLKLPKSK